MKARIGLLLFIAAFGICTTTPAMAAPVSDEVRITTTSSDARTDFTSAMKLTANLHTDEAFKLFEHATTLDPKFAMAHYMLAILSPNTESAMSHLATATSLTENITEGEKLLIEAYHAYLAGDTKQYEELTRRVVQMHPDDAWARLTLGDFLRNTSRNEEAITGIRQDPHDPARLSSRTQPSRLCEYGSRPQRSGRDWHSSAMSMWSRTNPIRVIPTRSFL